MWWEVLFDILKSSRIFPSAVPRMDLYFLVLKKPFNVPAPVLHIDFCWKWVVNTLGKFSELLDEQIAK